mmetsp:Transcript_1050/g.2606  ORF Transcript_1050/g.2606 Transcript_1050/m.2606 type:complete len:484 (+) Transcript_1050:244-1695(+)|eukprot:jgi/Tetstr1/448016/TSEL_035317.t1
MAPRPRLRAGRPLVLLAAVCLARIASVSGQEYGSRLAYGSWEDYTAVAGRDGRQVALGPLPSMQEVSNNRTKRAVPVEKEWIVLAGYRPELAEPSPTILPDGRLVKVEVTGYGRCLDGSWPVYYFAYGAQPTKWVIELEGGDWCTRFDRGDDSRERSKDERRNCFDRRELGGLQGGTTKEDPEYLDIKEMGDQAAHLSSNSNRNPMMHDWNKVFVRNCDGSSFTSSRPGIFTGADDGDDDDDNDGLYMQGKQILDGVVSDLLFNKHLGHAREVVIAGCSAGGLAVMIHADSIAERIRGNALNLRRPDAADIKIRALADSGFFLAESCGDGDQDYHARMEWLYENHNSLGGLNPKCVASYGENATDYHMCLFAEVAVRHLETPLFIAQSIMDGWGLVWIGCENEPAFREKMSGKLAEVVSLPGNGGFMDACRHHCHCHESIEIDGSTHVDAFRSWYRGDGDKSIWFKPDCEVTYSYPECPEKNG